MRLKQGAGRQRAGFTLVELVVVIAVIAILTALALPNYQTSVRKSRRADVQKDLLGFAGDAERIFTETNSYVTATLPANTPYYTFSFVAGPTAATWTIRATPVGGQSADRCGAMTLTHTGQRTHSGTEAGCW